MLACAFVCCFLDHWYLYFDINDTVLAMPQQWSNIAPMVEYCRSAWSRWAWTGGTTGTGGCWAAPRRRQTQRRGACSSSLPLMAASGKLPYDACLLTWTMVGKKLHQWCQLHVRERPTNKKCVLSGCMLVGEADSLDILIRALLREGAREGPLWAALERHQASIKAAMPAGAPAGYAVSCIIMLFMLFMLNHTAPQREVLHQLAALSGAELQEHTAPRHDCRACGHASCALGSPRIRAAAAAA